MPRELTGAEEVAFNRYQSFGTPEEVAKIISTNAELKTENAERRKENKALTEERDAAKALVPEGAKVLTGDEAKAYEALTAKGVKLSDVDSIVTERDTLKDKDAKRTRRDGLTKAGETEGYVPESVPVLDKLLGDLPFEVKDEDVEVKQDGKQVKRKMPVGYVTVDGKPVRLSAWAEAEGYPAQLFTANGKSAAGESGRPVPDMRGNGGPPKAGEVTDKDVRNSTLSTMHYGL